ncbi:MAG: hypothetical protein GEU81_14375 [Nitriliruptorales bacterium]|nr:hypothetical protein [Nitriliruptorales bacterium]
MKTTVLHEPNMPLEFEDVAVPEPGVGEALVRLTLNPRLLTGADRIGAAAPGTSSATRWTLCRWSECARS